MRSKSTTTRYLIRRRYEVMDYVVVEAKSPQEAERKAAQDFHELQMWEKLDNPKSRKDVVLQSMTSLGERSTVNSASQCSCVTSTKHSQPCFVS